MLAAKKYDGHWAYVSSSARVTNKRKQNFTLQTVCYPSPNLPMLL